MISSRIKHVTVYNHVCTLQHLLPTLKCIIKRWEMEGWKLIFGGNCPSQCMTLPTFILAIHSEKVMQTTTQITWPPSLYLTIWNYLSIDQLDCTVHLSVIVCSLCLLWCAIICVTNSLNLFSSVRMSLNLSLSYSRMYGHSWVVEYL